MFRKSVGTQIRSVFNVTDPLSREFSDDSDDETIVENLSNLNCSHKPESSVDYLNQWAVKDSTSMFVNHSKNVSEVNSTVDNEEFSKSCSSPKKRKISDPDSSEVIENILKVVNSSKLADLKNIRRDILHNIFQKKSSAFDSSQFDDTLAADTPEENDSFEMFANETEIIPESDVSFLSDAA